MLVISIRVFDMHANNNESSIAPASLEFDRISRAIEKVQANTYQTPSNEPYSLRKKSEPSFHTYALFSFRC